MSQDYRPMWESLGLNLPMHDALLDALGKMYTETFLSQTNRPKQMDYFNFVMSEIHGLRIQELLAGKKNGHKVVGTYCTFVPEEIVKAAAANCVGLCAGADFALDKVEALLPRNTCALIKSTLGFKLAQVCPYLESTDMVVGENTCDGKKKAYEVFGNIQKNLYIMDMPQIRSPEGKALMLAEYHKFKAAMEQLTGVTISVERLKAAIDLVNQKRQAVHRLNAVRAADPAPISGLDALAPIPIVTTGYGRELLKCVPGVSMVTEIKAFAAGVNFLHPEVRTIVDIGGQDTKVIWLDAGGRLSKFELNDRCSAGTGRFLEIMAVRLGYALPEFGFAALSATGITTINALCTVFAESEVVGLLNKGIPREDIALALHRTVSHKLLAMVQRSHGPVGPIAFAGGVAYNPAMVQLLSDVMGQSVLVPKSPQIMGALGAALIAQKSIINERKTHADR